jgi:hypothetical protein
MPHLGSITSEYDANEKEAGAIEAVEKFCPPIAVSPDVKMKLILSSEINQRRNIVNTDGPTYDTSISNKTSLSISKKRKYLPAKHTTLVSKAKWDNNSSVKDCMVNLGQKEKIQVTLHQCMDFYVTR